MLTSQALASSFLLIFSFSKCSLLRMIPLVKPNLMKLFRTGLSNTALGISMFAAWPSAAEAAHHQTKPNIVIILADDLGFAAIAAGRP